METAGAFEERFGEERTPTDLDARDLKGWGVARTIRKVVRSEVEEAVLARNTGVEQKVQVEFRQIGAFEYADNVCWNVRREEGVCNVRRVWVRGTPLLWR